MADVRRAPALLLSLTLLLALGLTLGCGNDDSGPSAPAIDTVPPAIPGGISAYIGVGNHPAVHLSWDANVTDADLAGYAVYRSDKVGSGFVAVGPALISANAWSDTDVEAGQTYYYRVAARDANANESGLSAQYMQELPSDMSAGIGPKRIHDPNS